MKKKIELVCWILFTVCSGIGFFINFMSTPPVNDTHTFTLHMIGAVWYPYYTRHLCLFLD